MKINENSMFEFLDFLDFKCFRYLRARVLCLFYGALLHKNKHHWCYSVCRSCSEAGVEPGVRLLEIGKMNMKGNCSQTLEKTLYVCKITIFWKNTMFIFILSQPSRVFALPGIPIFDIVP